jgi:hypothetical protein
MNYFNETKLMNRRGLMFLGTSAVLLSGCQMAVPGMTGALTGGAGKEADWGSLIKSLHAALDKVADQTEELLNIQASYLDAVGEKDKAAVLKGKAIAMKDRSGLDLGGAKKETASAKKVVLAALKKGKGKDAAAKRILQSGINRHKKAVENAWVGAAMIVKVVIDAQSAQKPSFKDMEAVGYMKEILADGPKAINFVKTSKSTYEDYAEAFEYEAKIIIPKPPKTESLGM